MSSKMDNASCDSRNLLEENEATLGVVYQMSGGAPRSRGLYMTGRGKAALSRRGSCSSCLTAR